QVFKDATTFFSRATPNLATIIPAIDHIDEILTSHESDKSLNGSVRAALSLGKKTLDQYYSLTDSSEVYQITMVLHLCHKLSYFQTAGWTADWIQTAEKLVHDEFDRHYARIVVDAGPEIETVEASITTKVCGMPCSIIFTTN
ncbi:hypothetical protein BDR06DRAFT_891921, partial [Suillus hirtellus]